MINKLFTNRTFGIILLLVIGFDLINSISQLTSQSDTISVLILRYLSLAVCLAALVFFFIYSRHSLSVIKLYIVFKLMIFPAYALLNDLKDLLFYGASRMEIEDYIAMTFSLIVGCTVYYFFKKYKVSSN